MVNLKFVSNDCHYFILRTLVLYYYNDYLKKNVKEESKLYSQKYVFLRI